MRSTILSDGCKRNISHCLGYAGSSAGRWTIFRRQLCISVPCNPQLIVQRLEVRPRIKSSSIAGVDCYTDCPWSSITMSSTCCHLFCELFGKWCALPLSCGQGVKNANRIPLHSPLFNWIRNIQYREWNHLVYMPFIFLLHIFIANALLGGRTRQA